MRLEIPIHASYGFYWQISTVALSISPGQQLFLVTDF